MYNLKRITEMKNNADYLSNMMKGLKIDNKSNEIQLKFRVPNKIYDMKCINCKSLDIYMHTYYELQKCEKCDIVYVPKELEMK
jgi:hypothetical protein